MKGRKRKEEERGQSLFLTFVFVFREALHDITFGCDRQIVSSFHQMIHSYYSFYKDGFFLISFFLFFVSFFFMRIFPLIFLLSGASRLSEIWEEAQQVQKLYEGEIPQQMPTAPRPSSVSLSSGTGSPLSQCSPNESQNVQFKVILLLLLFQKRGRREKKEKIMNFCCVDGLLSSQNGDFFEEKEEEGKLEEILFYLKKKVPVLFCSIFS